MIPSLGRGALPVLEYMLKDAGSNFHGMLLEAGVETKDQLATMLGRGWWKKLVFGYSMWGSFFMNFPHFIPFQ